MNWDRHDWDSMVPRNDNIDVPTSNLRHTFHEVPISAPYGVVCRDMIEANQVTLRFYKTACRLVYSP